MWNFHIHHFSHWPENAPDFISEHVYLEEAVSLLCSIAVGFFGYKIARIECVKKVFYIMTWFYGISSIISINISRCSPELRMLIIFFFLLGLNAWVLGKWWKFKWPVLLCSLVNDDLTELQDVNTYCALPWLMLSPKVLKTKFNSCNFSLVCDL